MAVKTALVLREYTGPGIGGLVKVPAGITVEIALKLVNKEKQKLCSVRLPAEMYNQVTVPVGILKEVG